MGSDFDDFGMYLVMSCKKTLSARSTVIVSVILSCEHKRFKTLIDHHMSTLE